MTLENELSDPYGLSLISGVLETFQNEMTQAYEITMKNTLKKIKT